MMRGSGTVLVPIELQQRHNWWPPTPPLDPNEPRLLKPCERAILCVAVEAELQGGDVTEFHCCGALASGKEVEHYGQVERPAREMGSPDEPILPRKQATNIHPDWPVHHILK